MPDAHHEDIEKLESLYAENPEGRIFAHLAEAYRKAGELDRAAEVLKSGIDRHPDYSSAHVVLGRVLVDSGRPADAESAFLRVLELDPHNLVALRSLGELARAAGRSDEALERYHRLLDIEPSDDQVRARIRELTEDLAAVGEDHSVENVGSRPPWSLEPNILTEEEAVDAPPRPEEEAGAMDAGAEAVEPPEARTEESEAAAAEPDGIEREEIERDEIEREEIEREGIGPAFQEPAWASPGAAEPAASDEDEEPREGDSAPTVTPGVMTETIAQVYARQGLYDRAAEVYRELLRSRPDDAGLRQQLEEAERLAGRGVGEQGPGAVEPEPVEPVPGEPMDLPDWPEPGEAGPAASGLPEWSQSVDPDEGAGLELPAWDESAEPAPTTGPALPEWTDSEGEEAVSPAETGDEPVPDFDLPTEAGSVWVSNGWGGDNLEAEPTPYAWAETESEPAADDSPPIRSYLESILTWSPDAPADGSDAAPESEGHEMDQTGPSDPVGEAGDDGEQTGDPEVGGTAEAGSTVRSQSGGEVGGAGGENGEEEDPSQGERGEDDDDLETFRSWLENLKQ